MLQSIAQWFKSKGGFAHVAAAIFTAAMLAYAAVPDFHALVLQIHQALPAWLQELVTTALALYAWYKTTDAKPGTGDSKIPPVAFIVLCLVLLPLATGCKTVSTTQPLAPWAANQADEQAGSIIAAADAVVVRYEADMKAGFQPVPAFRAVIADMQQTLAVAQPAYDAWHNALKTNPQAGEPAAVTAAVVTLAADLAKLPALAGN